jgi:hypothetical protein
MKCNRSSAHPEKTIATTMMLCLLPVVPIPSHPVVFASYPEFPTQSYRDIH